MADPHPTFSSFSHLLDPRLLRALADMSFARPTPIQAKAIPLGLEGRDILARARTGSGKTAAYCLPLVQKVLAAKAALPVDDPSRQATRALILVPTRELAEQVSAFLRGLVIYCEKEVVVANIASGTTTHLQRITLSDKPDVVVSTPSRLLGLLQSKTLTLTSLETLVIDEADLILSYGHAPDLQHIFSQTSPTAYLPKIYQSVLMSATMSEDVEELKGLTLRDPVILKLEESEEEAASLTQYYVRCSEPDKFLLTYVILKLRLIPGKCLLFVNNVDRSYRLKLFLEQFGIRSCVLNSELPLNSRYHTVQEFNKGVYDYIIATDESGVQEATEGPEGIGKAIVSQPQDQFTSTQRDAPELENENEVEPEPHTSSHKRKRKRSSSPALQPTKSKHKSGKTSSKEYNPTRGIDFLAVSCVLNFDLPTSTQSYTHRIGRTARAGHSGLALSFVVPRELWGKDKVVGCVPSAKGDEELWENILEEQRGRGGGVGIKEYVFDRGQVEAFRYRMEDALRAITRSAVREARVRELRMEVMNSEKLKAHFEDNPLDLEYLRHDKPLHPTRVQPHMKHVPQYLLPRVAPVTSMEAGESNAEKKQPSFVPFKKGGARGRGRGGGRGGRGGRGGKKKSDPLKKFGK